MSAVQKVFTLSNNAKMAYTCKLALKIQHYILIFLLDYLNIEMNCLKILHEFLTLGHFILHMYNDISNELVSLFCD